MGFMDTVTIFFNYFWWVIPIVGILVYLLAQQFLRKIQNKVLYIRRGGTAEFHPCTIVGGSHIKFAPDMPKKFMTIHLDAQPYVMSKGLNTSRIYTVVQGGGSTVRFSKDEDRYLDFNDLMDDSYRELSDEVKAILSEEDFKGISGKLLNKSSYNVVVEAIEEGDAIKQAASSSVALFQHVNEAIIEKIPDNRKAWLAYTACVFGGYFAGITMGMIIIQMGWLS